LPTLCLLVLGIVGVLYGQQLTDMALASSFHPSERVAALNTRLQLTSEGTNLLYASHTNIEDKKEFNNSCQSSERTAAILGCYYRRQIHLFNVSNPELDGAIEVTAAHEMLHAAYERLNFFERARVDKLIEAEYDNLRKDPTIAEEMAYYQKAEPGAEINELHSIIGTTVAQVSPELEHYYAQYFKDRASVVAMNEKYTAVFQEINKKAEMLQAAITAKEPVIKQELADYDTDREQLEIDIQTFNERASSQGFSTQSSFTLARNTLMRRVNELNARRDIINAEVKSYNDMINELTQLSVKVNQYNESLNGVEAASGV
jgi:hypothetical protein